jgi:hypothetical protein
MRDPLQRCIQPITSTQKAQLNSKRREGLRFLHRASPSFQPVVYLSLDTLVLAKVLLLPSACKPREGAKGRPLQSLTAWMIKPRAIPNSDLQQDLVNLAKLQVEVRSGSTKLCNPPTVLTW